MSSLVDTSTVNTLSLINQLREYEPNLVKLIFDMVFVPCSQDRQGKHKYIRAMPTPGTNTICGNALYGNKILEWVIIDNSVETIGYGAFLGCSDLTHVTIGDSMETIGSRAFARCSSLNHLTNPNTVKTNGYAAIYEF
mgnify:CR=1 FL=1